MCKNRLQKQSYLYKLNVATFFCLKNKTVLLAHIKYQDLQFNPFNSESINMKLILSDITVNVEVRMVVAVGNLPS